MYLILYVSVEYHGNQACVICQGYNKCSAIEHTGKYSNPLYFIHLFQVQEVTLLNLYQHVEIN